MTDRIRRMKEALKVDKYPFCAEKAKYVIESWRQNEGLPSILRRAKATAHYLDNRTIYIDDDELICGNVAAKPMGMEASVWGPFWDDEELDSILEGSYLVRFAYEGDGNVSLPLEEGQMIVEGGSLTLIELEAAERTGRVAVATGREGLEGGFSLKEEETGAVFGPYAFDEEGRAVSALLGEGQYELELSLPESALLREAVLRAKRADVVVMACGISARIEGEEGELAQIQLPGTRAAKAAMEELKARVPQASFSAPEKKEAHPE